MSAKHKRPFLVFAAVAVICCMVMLTGVRSKAVDSHAPDLTAAPVAPAGPPIGPLPEVAEAPAQDEAAAANAAGATRPSGREGSAPSAPPRTTDTEPDGARSHDRPSGSGSGMVVVQPLEVPTNPAPVDVVPVVPGDSPFPGKRAGQGIADLPMDPPEDTPEDPTEDTPERVDPDETADQGEASKQDTKANQGEKGTKSAKGKKGKTGEKGKKGTKGKNRATLGPVPHRGSS